MWLALAVSLANAATGAGAATPRANRLSPLPLPAPALGLGLAASRCHAVSGLSSGAYMAGQFHVALSGTLAGAAVLASGTYGCSRGAVSTAMYHCSCPANPGRCSRG